MMLNRNFAYACEIIQNFNLHEFGQGFDLSQKFWYQVSIYFVS